MQDGNKLEVDRHHGLDAMAFKLRTVSGSQPGNREWSLRMQFLNCHALLFTSSGQGWITVDGRFIEISPGGVYVGFPGQYVEAFIHTLDEQGMYWMLFEFLRKRIAILPKAQPSKKRAFSRQKRRFFRNHRCRSLICAKLSNSNGQRAAA
jgi:hypothetical protein